jgi:hypothetical protein
VQLRHSLHMLHRFGATSLKVAVRDTDLVVPSSAARCGGAVALLQLVPSKLPTPLLLAAVDSRGRLACSSFTAVNVDTFFLGTGCACCYACIGTTELVWERPARAVQHCLSRAHKVYCYCCYCSAKALVPHTPCQRL